MKNAKFILGLVMLVVASLACREIEEVSKPNVVFIIVDDLNDMVYQPDGKPLVQTPNIDRLKNSGVTFTNAHTNAPLCAPSRASMLMGLYPQTTGLYWFEKWEDNGILNKSVSLNDNLRNSHYKVYGTGKIYHGPNHPYFDEYGYNGDFGPWPWDGREETHQGLSLPHSSQSYLFEGPDADIDYQWEHTFGPLSDIPHWPADPATNAPGYKGWVMAKKPWRYVNDEDRDLLADENSVAWTRDVINRNHKNPYALFVGLIRTHTPLYAPQKYFDRFPLASIEMPDIDPNDLEDVAKALGNEALYGFRRYKMLSRHEGKDLLRHWMQAYMACVSFIDDQVGAILDAIENGPDKENTVIILTSDHGFHIGEKNFLYKGSLWEPSTRVPLIISGIPDAPKGESCNQPVSLIDMYPTFNELCNLNKNPNLEGNGYELEGHSLLPLIKDPVNGTWDGPDVAITAIPGKNHMQHQVYDGTLFPHFSVRGKRYRYSLTSDGGEELYDHQTDPLEWKNLAYDPNYYVIKESLKMQLLELRDGNKWKSLQNRKAWKLQDRDETVMVREGKIRLSGKKEFQLTTIDSYSNFELQFIAKATDQSSFSLLYRDDDHQITMPLFGSKEAVDSGFKDNDWNMYRLRVFEGRQQLWINNRFVSDIQNNDDKAKSHSIIINYSGGAGSVEIREAGIREL